jgi:hypothetical protein
MWRRACRHLLPESCRFAANPLPESCRLLPFAFDTDLIT